MTKVIENGMNIISSNEKNNNNEKITYSNEDINTFINSEPGVREPLRGCRFLRNYQNMNFYKLPKMDFLQTDEIISILFVGQSGTGKTTFINAFSNIILGIKPKDKFRYILIDEGENALDQMNSITNEVTIYKIRGVNKSYNLIDSPGYGDTRGVAQDEKYLGLFSNLFQNEIDGINAICFIVKACENRYNDFQKKIIKDVTNLFSTDISQNLFGIFTFGSRQNTNAHRLLTTIDIFDKKEKNNENWKLIIDSTLFLFGLTKDYEISMCLEQINYFENFIETLNSMPKNDTKLTKQNLSLKKSYEDLIKQIQNRISDKLVIKYESLSKTKKSIEDNEKKLTDYNNKLKELNEKIKNENSKINEIDEKIKKKKMSKQKIKQK